MNEHSRLRWQWIATTVSMAAAVALLVGISAAERNTSEVTQAAATTVAVTDQDCGSSFGNLSTGPASFAVDNLASWPTEVYLVKLPDMGTLFRTVILGPGSTVSQNAVLAPGNYAFQCLQGGKLRATSASFTVTGDSPGNATPAILQASTGELQQSNNLYLKQALGTLSAMTPQLQALTSALEAGDAVAARGEWLAARQSWAGLGAAYGSFGAAGDAIAGVRNPALEPAADPDFSGLGRIEFGLFNNQPLDSLLPVVKQLEADVAALSMSLPSLSIVPGALQLRAHEILEDTLRDTLSGQNDRGASMAFAITSADVAATRSTVANLAGPLERRRPGFVLAINNSLDAVDAGLAALQQGDTWLTLEQATPTQRLHVNAAVSAALELLADIPQLLALPQGSE